MLEQRLRELCEVGAEDQARTLALSVLRNQTIRSLDVQGTELVVTTEFFHGTHQLTATPPTPETLSDGTYTVASTEVNFRFSPSSPPPNVEEAVAEQFEGTESSFESATASSTAADTTSTTHGQQQESVADTTPALKPDGGHQGTHSSRGVVSSVVRQIQMGVQNWLL